MVKSSLKPGDWVIYRKTKRSPHPGPRATNIAPATHGDQYAYTVDKFWIVQEVKSDGAVIVATRRGKQHVIEPETPTLRKANFWERWRFKSRFEAIENQPVNNKSVEEKVVA